MRDQLEQMQNMGGLAGLMDKLPGMGQIPDHVKSQVTGKEVPRMVAIINSMTKKERRHPDLAERLAPGPRRQGLGHHAGRRQPLLKQYQQMEKMMSKLSAGGMKGMMRGMKGLMGGGVRRWLPGRLSALTGRHRRLRVFLTPPNGYTSRLPEGPGFAPRPGIHPEL